MSTRPVSSSAPSFTRIGSRAAAVAAVALALGAAPLHAQRAARSAATRDTASTAPSTSPSTTATKNAPVATAPEAVTGGFTEGHLYVGPRVWTGVYGTMAVGVSAEKSLGGPRKDLGNGRIGVGGAVDLYSYSDGFAGYRYSYRVIPISGFANYHFTLKNPKFDPYAGLAMGYYVVSASVDGPGIDRVDYDTRANALFLGVQLGARYFVKPNLAVQAQTGIGLGALSLGVTWQK